MKVVLLFMHLLLMGLTTINAVNADNNTNMILWIICAVCWGLCSVIDVVNLTR
jgi:hypothetical protein